MENNPILLLYFKPTCPFSQKVLGFLSEAEQDVPLKDISSDEDARDELLHLGGKLQVPCLFINGKALYESDEIIKWLSEHFEETS